MNTAICIVLIWRGKLNKLAKNIYILESYCVNMKYRNTMIIIV